MYWCAGKHDHNRSRPATELVGCQARLSSAGGLSLGVVVLVSNKAQLCRDIDA